MTQPSQPAPAPVDHRRRLSEQVEARMSGPVIGAAVASVPAVFLSTWHEPYATVGTVLNWASLTMLTAESLVLMLLARDRLAFIRRHRWKLAITVAAVPAVAFAVAPVQALRLLRVAHFVGTLQVLRAKRIVKAGRVISRRIDLVGRWRHLPVVIAALIALGFVALVLADPAASSAHQEAIDQVIGLDEAALVLVAGSAAILAALLLVIRYRRGSRRADPLMGQDDGGASDTDP